MLVMTFRRHYLDKVLAETDFRGRVLDIGGKKINKRGRFRPPVDKVETWEYLNIDESTEPDYLCSAEHIPVDDNSFDILLLTEILEHLENPEVVLKECFRVLKKGGKLIATMPFLYPVHADPYDFQRWTDARFRNTLEKIGFTGIKVTPMGGIFAVIYDLLYASMTSASKNRRSIKNRVLKRVFMPSVARIFLRLDQKYIYKSKAITTGYYVEASK